MKNIIDIITTVIQAVALIMIFVCCACDAKLAPFLILCGCAVAYGLCSLVRRGING